MKFQDVKVGRKFKLDNKIYTKIENIMKTCCEVKFNAIRKDGKKVKIGKETEVEKLK